MTTTRYIETDEYTPFQEDWDYESYDKSIADFCASLFTNDEKALPITFATPDRAFAQMKTKFKLRDNQPIPLPFLSIQQIGDSVPDPTRRLCHKIYKRMGEVYNSDGSINCGLRMQWPLPYNFTYSIELWVKTRKEARRYLRQYAEQFEHGDYSYIAVDHGEGMGLQLVRVENQGLADNTQLETGAEQRILRWTATILVYGWLPRRIQEVPIVKKISVSIEDMT